MTDDGRDPPTSCPDCGGDVQETPTGRVCEDCDRVVFVMDSRG